MNVAAQKAPETQEAYLSRPTGRWKASLLPQCQVPQASQEIDCLKFKLVSFYFMTDFTPMGNPQGKKFALFHAKLLPTGFREVLPSLGIFIQVF